MIESKRPRAPLSDTSSSNGLAIASSAASMARRSPDASPVPIMAVPMPLITVRTSAKSRLMRPSFKTRSTMQATPEYRTWSASTKASAKVVRSLAMRNRFWFGITISVSTCWRKLCTPVSEMRSRRAPSNRNGFVTMPTVRMPSSRAARAITPAAPVPVPPPMPAAMKTMCEPTICARISSIASSAAASPISGFDPAPRPSVKLAPS